MRNNEFAHFGCSVLLAEFQPTRKIFMCLYMSTYSESLTCALVFHYAMCGVEPVGMLPSSPTSAITLQTKCHQVNNWPNKQPVNYHSCKIAIFYKLCNQLRPQKTCNDLAKFVRTFKFLGLHQLSVEIPPVRTLNRRSFSIGQAP